MAVCTLTLVCPGSALLAHLPRSTDRIVGELQGIQSNTLNIPCDPPSEMHVTR